MTWKYKKSKNSDHKDMMSKMDDELLGISEEDVL